jgi:putative transposase
MGFKYAIRNDHLHFLTHTIVDWIDLFTRRELAMVVVDSLNYCIENKGLEVYVWCLMPSHLHMIASVRQGNPQTLPDVMRDFKSFTSRELQSEIDSEFESRREWLKRHFEKGRNEHQVWQEGFLPTNSWTRRWITST